MDTGKSSYEEKAETYSAGAGGERMIVGIMADTHDNLPLVDKAVKRFEEEKVELVLHAGDYISPFVIPHFKPFKERFIGVFGNNDGDHEFLKRRFTEFGLEIRGYFAEVKVDSLRIVLLHGGEPGGPPGASELLRSLISAGCYDVIVHGHVHEAKAYREGKTLIINPGEVCGYLTGKSTLAILDTERVEARIIELK